MNAASMHGADTTIRGVNPVLPVRDVEETVSFYRDKLGFSETFRYGDPPTYAGMARGPVEIHLCLVDDIAIAHQTQVRFRVERIEQLYEEYLAQDVVSPTAQLDTKPWGTREFGLYDPNGVCVYVYEDLPS